MEQYRYDVTMRTLLGEKHGTLAFSILNAHVTGFLNILKQRCTLSGDVNENGGLTLVCTLNTPVRAIPMRATGEFTKDEINLSFLDKTARYSIHGIKSLQQGGKTVGED